MAKRRDLFDPTDPASFQPEQRLNEVAAILAAAGGMPKPVEDGRRHVGQRRMQKGWRFHHLAPLIAAPRTLDERRERSITVPVACRLHYRCAHAHQRRSRMAEARCEPKKAFLPNEANCEKRRLTPYATTNYARPISER